MRTYRVFYTDGTNRVVEAKSVHDFQTFLHNEGDHVKNWEYLYKGVSNAGK